MINKILLLMAVVLPLAFNSYGNDYDSPMTHEEHEFVDLGLPSRTLWATCNIGATTPERSGCYFAWGETEPMSKLDSRWDSYKWCRGSMNTMTKYCTSSNYGSVDNIEELDPEDDAAYVNWGPHWRIPTIEQQKELMDSCSWHWTRRNGESGYLVTGPNGNTIFLPAAGNRGDYYRGGLYWSRTLGSHRLDPNRSAFVSCYAYCLSFYSGAKWAIRDYRYLGFTVRAVYVP